MFHDEPQTPESNGIHNSKHKLPRPCSVCDSPRLCRRRERCLIEARFWPLAVGVEKDLGGIDV